MKIFLDESSCRQGLRPFTLTRHAADIRIGILTIREKWELLTAVPVTTERPPSDSNEWICIPANVIPTIHNYQQIIDSSKDGISLNSLEGVFQIEYPWHIFQYNDPALRSDFELLTRQHRSHIIHSSNQCILPEKIFIEEGAEVNYSILNASTGPIYIGKNANIMEGSMIRGPFSLGESSVLKMGTKIYGATTVGPHCVAGGEIKNSVLQAFSNKAHDGYLGDSVIGQWCNLGAGTSNSNVKNTGSAIRYYLEPDKAINAGNKGGLIMGDYSRAAINTSFNTGTIVGVCCNVFGNAFPPKFIPDFTWGDQRYEFEKAIADISNWKKMKHQEITSEEISCLTSLYQSTK